MTDQECLAMIREKYGVLLGVSASAWGHRPEVLAGIMCRESRGGTSSLLDVQGPEGRGDHGFGHGLMQIDSRSFPEFCAGELWKRAADNIDMGALALFEKKTYLSTKGAQYFRDPSELERAAIAAYNCGQGNVIRALRDNLDVDYFTAHGDYSRTVLTYSEIYRQLAPPEPVELPPVETPKIRANLLALILKLFRR